MLFLFTPTPPAARQQRPQTASTNSLPNPSPRRVRPPRPPFAQRPHTHLFRRSTNPFHDSTFSANPPNSIPRRHLRKSIQSPNAPADSVKIPSMNEANTELTAEHAVRLSSPKSKDARKTNPVSSIPWRARTSVSSVEPRLGVPSPPKKNRPTKRNSAQTFRQIAPDSPLPKKIKNSPTKKDSPAATT
jgi:hypothetical protein